MAEVIVIFLVSFASYWIGYHVGKRRNRRR